MIQWTTKLTISLMVPTTSFLTTLAFFNDACAVCDLMCCCKVAPNDFRIGCATDVIPPYACLNPPDFGWCKGECTDWVTGLPIECDPCV